MFPLTHVALYSKGHYIRGDVWEDMIQCLRGDKYDPTSREDVLWIISNNVSKLYTRGIEYYTREFIDAINPNECWKRGYYTKDHTWIKEHDKLKSYDQKTAILWFMLSELSLSNIVDLGWDIKNPPKPDVNILMTKAKIEKRWRMKKKSLI